MRITTKDYKPNEIFRFIREGSNLTQKEMGAELNKRGKNWANEIESGKNRFYFEDLLLICNNHNIKIYIININKKIDISNLPSKDIFRTIRNETKMSRKDLAESLNKSANWVKQIELGNHRFYFNDLYDICNKNNIILVFEK